MDGWLTGWLVGWSVRLLGLNECILLVFNSTMMDRRKALTKNARDIVLWRVGGRMVDAKKKKNFFHFAAKQQKLMDYT